MGFEQDDLSTMLDMTNVLPLPDDWFSRPGDYGLYRAYEIAGPTPVVAEVQIGDPGDADQTTLYVPCALGKNGPTMYGAIAFSSPGAEGLTLTPWQKDEVERLGTLRDQLYQELMAAGIDPSEDEVTFPEWYVQANAQAHQSIKEIHQQAAKQEPEIMRGLEMQGIGVERVSSLDFISRAKHPQMHIALE